MRIALHYDGRRAQVFDVLLEPKIRGELQRRLGIEMVDQAGKPITTESFDGVIAHQQFLTPRVLDAGLPAVMVERRDSSVLWERELAAHENVRAVWKIAVAAKRMHRTRLLRPYTPWIGGSEAEELPQIANGVFEKLFAQPAYLHYGPMARWRPMLYREVTPAEARVLNVSYRGKERYPQCTEIEGHRRAAVQQIRQLPIATATGGRVNRGTYDKELTRSKIVVSPYGYGELCWRDYEAVCAGCMLVKPPCQYVETQDRLLCGGFYEEVLPDFSNLRQVVCELISDPERLQHRIDRARSQLRAALTAESVLKSLTAPLLRLLDR